MNVIAGLIIVILILIIVIILLIKSKNKTNIVNTGIVKDIIELEKKAKDVKNEKKSDNIDDLINKFCEVKRKY